MNVIGIDVGIKNLALCGMDADGEISYWGLIKCTDANIGDLNITECVVAVTKSLQNVDTSGVTDIAVEMQPCGGKGAVSAANTRMRCVQAAIESWATTRRLPIKAIAAQSKIPNSRGMDYKQRKKRGIEMVLGDLKTMRNAHRDKIPKHTTLHPPSWESWFRSVGGKMDDLADAYLIANIYRNRFINERTKLYKDISKEIKKRFKPVGKNDKKRPPQTEECKSKKIKI